MNTPTAVSFDLVLVCLNFRFHPYYLNIVKELGKTHSIGIYLFDNDKRAKTQATEEAYLDLCRAFGATVCQEGQISSCRLMLVLQPNFAQDAERIKGLVKYQKVIQLQHVRSGDSLISSVKHGGITYWIFNRTAFDSNIKLHSLQSLVDRVELVEVAFPFQKYPALDFKELEIDYIIAYPSRIFLKDKQVELDLMNNMVRLIKSIPQDQSLYLKQHNVRDLKPFLKNPLYIAELKTAVKTVIAIFKAIARQIIGKGTNWAEDSRKLKIERARNYINRKTTPLSTVTKYHNMNIEFFLPFVKKGVITGISGVIRNALLQKIPVYNCDCQEINENTPNYHDIKSYMIPCCHGELKFDPAAFELVKGENEPLDMIKLIESELK